MDSDQRPAIRDLFDATAASYDHVGVTFFAPVAERLITELAVQPGERCLDIGCGRGAALFPLARAAGPGTTVGIDLAPKMVAATAADALAAGLDLTVQVGDAQEPDLPAGSFDVISASLVLFFLPAPGDALVRWRELLTDDGRVGISTFGDHSDSWKDVDAVFAPYLPPGMTDPRTLAASPFASDDGVAGLFGAAGFSDVTTTHLTVEVRFDSTEQWHEWTWSQGQRRMWMAVPEDERATVRAAAEARLELTRDADGRIGFDQVIRYTIGRA